MHSVGEYASLPAARSAYTVFRFDRGELSDYLFRTRNDRAFPDEELLERLRAAVRKAIGERPADVGEGPAVVYVAPLSPVSNDLWVYWENGHRIIRFSSDADLTQKIYWDLAGVDVHVYDLHENVVVSLGEVPGSSKYVTRDWAARVLFNCIALGQKVILPPAGQMNQGDPFCCPGRDTADVDNKGSFLEFWKTQDRWTEIEVVHKH